MSNVSNGNSHGEKLDYPNNDNVSEENYDRSLCNEAERVVKEISFGVKCGSVSDKLERSDSLAYINIRTLEDETWCVELTTSGYMIVSNEFDTIDENMRAKNLNNVYRFETFEALMHTISPLFVKRFNDSVAAKLEQLV
jgi:hypothetical protein